MRRLTRLNDAAWRRRRSAKSQKLPVTSSVRPAADRCLDGHPARLRSGEDVSADPRNPRRPVRRLRPAASRPTTSSTRRPAMSCSTPTRAARPATARPSPTRSTRPIPSHDYRRPDERGRRGDRERRTSIPNNLFVTGGSGGGVLTAWIVGKTDRFRAAATQKPVINWASSALTADGAPFFAPYWFGKMPWEDPTGLLGALAAEPGRQRQDADAVVVGSEDYRTPVSEAEQYYAALQLRGVPTAFVKVPGREPRRHRRAAEPVGGQGQRRSSPGSTATAPNGRAAGRLERRRFPSGRAVTIALATFRRTGCPAASARLCVIGRHDGEDIPLVRGERDRAGRRSARRRVDRQRSARSACREIVKTHLRPTRSRAAASTRPPRPRPSIIIVDQFRSAGLQPGGDVVERQAQLDAGGAAAAIGDRRRRRGHAQTAATADMPLTQGEQIAVRAPHERPEPGRPSTTRRWCSSATASTAPERNWDDFKGQDLQRQDRRRAGQRPRLRGRRRRFRRQGDDLLRPLDLQVRGSRAPRRRRRAGHPRNRAGLLRLGDGQELQHQHACSTSSAQNPAAAHTPLEGWIQRDVAVAAVQARGLDFEQAKKRGAGAATSSRSTLKATLSARLRRQGRDDHLAQRRRHRCPGKQVSRRDGDLHRPLGPSRRRPAGRARATRIYNGAVDNGDRHRRS